MAAVRRGTGIAPAGGVGGDGDTGGTGRYAVDGGEGIAAVGPEPIEVGGNIVRMLAPCPQGTCAPMYEPILTIREPNRGFILVARQMEMMMGISTALGAYGEAPVIQITPAIRKKTQGRMLGNRRNR